MLNRILMAALAASAFSGVAGAVEIDGPAEVVVEEMGVLALGAEEIGVSSGDFRTLRVTLAPGAKATLRGADGEVAVVFVERGAVAIAGEAMHAGTLTTLEGAASAELANPTKAAAVVLIADVIGVAK